MNKIFVRLQSLHALELFQASVNHQVSGLSVLHKKKMESLVPMSPDVAAGGHKRLSVERIYQKKTQLEHILLRPDTYIGSVEPVTQAMWVWDEGVGMVNRDITYVPGLYKIFDEIVVNAADNKQRDPKMSAIKIDIDREKNRISVWNDGKGIPVVEHKVEKMFVPEMIFGHLLTSSNYNDEDKKVTGGRNGYGAKLCNIFSTKFTVETSCKEYKKKFRQSWSDNMSKTHDRKIGVNDKSDYTKIMFQPDLAKFHMTELDKDIVALLSRRAYDLAGSSPKVKVYLNGRVIPVKNFKDYVQLYLCNAKEENGEPLTVVHEQVNPRWEICLTSSDKGFQQISFANSIATTKGGRHVDYVIDQVTKKLIEVVKRKNKGGVDVKPYQIKNHCWLFVNCLIENPTFDSQTKENMTLQSKKFGSKCNLTEKFLKQASSSGIVDNIMNWVKFKAQSQLQKKSAGKSNKLKGVPKLDDANDAGTKNSLGCTLILTEGDSAKTLAVSGLSVIGRDKYGVFPLRGKLLNVRDASHKQIMDNAEINNIIKIMGLKYNKKYEADDDLKTLRYGKLMIMTDQDHDGSHIKGLLINFIHSNWPHMLQRRVLEEFITPIVKVTKGSQVLSFYTIPEFEDWQANIGNPKSWKVKYYKGLGTSTSKEAKAYFADMLRHRVRFKYSGPEDDGCIDMAFNKKRADDRKDWLTNFMDERRRCREDSRPEPGSDLYSANTRTLSYKDFVNKELVMFSYADLERSVPSLVDGLKPGQRKVLYTCLRRNDKREVKVAQLAGSVAELSAYHHGEVSLQTTIINMAQNFVGSNNLNLLQPIGQFGTRLYGGKDSASPRYIFTMLSPLTRLLFPSVDDNLLTFNYDDSQKVEPTWYCPIIPMILVNGSEGIGTGWSTRIPNHDIREVVENCKRLMRDEEPKQMFPSYKNFRGTIQEIESNRYVISGEAAILDDSTFEITELPVRTWTQNYKENVLEPMAMGNEKVPQQIQDYKEYNTDTSVRFVITMTQQKLKEVDKKGLHKFMSVQTSFSVNNTLVLFDEFGCLRKFNNTLDILKEFFQLRLKLYEKRKHYLIGMLTADALKLKNQARFIVEKIEGKISIFNKAKKLLIQLLLEKKYDSDPVKAWKDSLKEETTEGSDEETQEDEETEDAKGSDYNYILNMPLWSLTKERKEDLLKQRDAKQKELEELMKKTPKMMWNDDLDKFMEELEKVEQKERDDDAAFVGSGKAATLGKGKKSKMKELAETKPSSQGLRIEPVVDEDMKKRLTTVDKKPSKAKLKRELEAKKLENGSGEAVVATSLTPVDDIDLDEPPSLMSRIIKSAEKKPAPRPRMKQSVLGFKAKPTKRNPWESSGSDSDEESAGEFGSTDFASDLAPREITKRATKIAATKKFTIDSDSFSSSDDEEIKDVVIAKETEKDEPVQVLASSASDDDFSKPSRDWNEVMGNSPIKSNAEKIPIKRKKMTASSGTTSSDGSSDKPARKMAKTTKKNDGKAKAKKPVTKPANKPLVSDSDDDAVIAVTSWTGSVAKTKKATKAKPKSTKAAPKKKNAPKRNAWSGSDDDNDDDELMIIESPIQPRSTPARRKPKAKYIFDDDEDDDDKDDDFKEADDDEDDDEDDDFKENDYDEDCA